MKKSDIIRAVSEKHNLSEQAAKQIVDMVFDGFTESLRRGDRIEIRGFGSFSIHDYEAYAGRNPKTGNEIKVPAKRLPHFKVGKELQKKVNKK
jgi:integration host factor subunit beta